MIGTEGDAGGVLVRGLKEKDNKNHIVVYSLSCHSERSEESRKHKVDVTEILRFVQDDII